MMHTGLTKFNCLHSQLLPLQALDYQVVEAFYRVRKEDFVPEDITGNAYVDSNLHVGSGRYIMDTNIFVRLVNALELKKDDVVLDVGCATGYSTALLSMLTSNVVAIEERRDLASKTRQNLKNAGLETGNIEVLTSTLAAGCNIMSPYNAIIIQGGVYTIPSVFFDRLADGGRLATVEMFTQRPGTHAGLGRAVLYEKDSDVITKKVLFDASATLLPGFEKKSNFEF